MYLQMLPLHSDNAFANVNVSKMHVLAKVITTDDCAITRVNRGKEYTFTHIVITRNVSFTCEFKR